MEHVSLMDMLPEREGIVPSGSSGGTLERKCIGLFAGKCARCGKHFEYYGEQHRYRIKNRGERRELIFCSYGCMRARERELEREKQVQEQKRAKRAAERIAQIEAMMRDPIWKTLTPGKRSTLINTLGNCREFLQDYAEKYGEEKE
ncbi:MAG: hypothetical protein PUH70_12285 [Clostridiales bacterium]|nr:hypothetical protein [Clostridiales bacterium]MDY5514849.1 hypothetical protein [Candidatus Ventricola sp.]